MRAGRPRSHGIYLRRASTSSGTEPIQRCRIALVVVYTFRGESVRLISARKASKAEAEAYYA